MFLTGPVCTPIGNNRSVLRQRSTKNLKPQNNKTWLEAYAEVFTQTYTNISGLLYADARKLIFFTAYSFSLKELYSLIFQVLTSRPSTASRLV